MYRQSSKLQHVMDILSSTSVGGCLSVYFENDQSTCFTRDGVINEIPKYQWMGIDMFRAYVSRVAGESGMVVKTKILTDSKKFLHIWRIL